MAKKQTAEQPKETKNTKAVCCLDCMHSDLHRYDDNPILAACHQKPQHGNERFPFEVVVASFLRMCSEYKKSDKSKEITQLTRRTA